MSLPRTCGRCDNLHYSRGIMGDDWTCDHSETPAVGDIPGLTDEQISEIPQERFELLTGTVHRDKPPPWWCPRRQL
jgi:hypothetical protein